MGHDLQRHNLELSGLRRVARFWESIDTKGVDLRRVTLYGYKSYSSESFEIVFVN